MLCYQVYRREWGREDKMLKENRTKACVVIGQGPVRACQTMGEWEWERYCEVWESLQVLCKPTQVMLLLCAVTIKP